MLTQEEYVNDVLAAPGADHRRNRDDDRLSPRHRLEVAAGRRTAAPAGGSPGPIVDERWKTRIAELATPPSMLLATTGTKADGRSR
jgi:hypothetical protein